MSAPTTSDDPTEIVTHFENKALGLSLDFGAITQGMVVAYVREIRAASAASPDISEAEMRGVRLKAAIGAKWIERPVMSVDMVDTLKPAVVKWLDSKIQIHHAAISTVPPD